MATNLEDYLNDWHKAVDEKFAARKKVVDEKFAAQDKKLTAILKKQTDFGNRLTNVETTLKSKVLKQSKLETRLAVVETTLKSKAPKERKAALASR